MDALLHLILAAPVAVHLGYQTVGLIHDEAVEEVPGGFIQAKGRTKQLLDIDLCLQIRLGKKLLISLSGCAVLGALAGIESSGGKLLQEINGQNGLAGSGASLNDHDALLHILEALVHTHLAYVIGNGLIIQQDEFFVAFHQGYDAVLKGLGRPNAAVIDLIEQIPFG